jgi:FkbM family methyltransferase
MHSIKTLFFLLKQIIERICIQSWLAAFLCGCLASMGNHRKWIKETFITFLNLSSKDGNVILKVKIYGKRYFFLMRQGNIADYLIGGELVWGAYKPPLQKPNLIVDGGANIGMFSVLAHSLFPDVPLVCYEPDKANLRQLKQNMAANGIAAKIVPKALWSKETTLFYHAGESYTGYVDEHPPGESIECAMAQVQNGCWLKLDIEGAEYEVLPEILSRGVRPAFISMEIHFNDQKGGGLMELLAKSGYKLRNPRDCKANCANVELDFAS